jgi:hypothetical protein
MRKIIPLLLLLVLETVSIAQTIRGKIVDQSSGEPLVFVAVAEAGTLNATYSDIDGIFELTLIDTQHVLHFNLTGYEARALAYNQLHDQPIKLRPLENLLSEITILPGVNPAERIIRKAIDNKRKNNPESDLAFTYDSYNILAFGAEIDSAMFQDSARFNQLSKDTKETYTFLKEQYLFLMESITQRKFMPPDHSEETIIANRVSGLKTTDLFLLGTQLQSFSFYGESVELLGVKYMSPLADNAINKYRFEWVDTTFAGSDTIFTITFQPKSKKNFPSMRGTLYINSNGFAIQQVVAEPSSAGQVSFKIQQQYAYLENRKWFPLQLNSKILFDSTVSASGLPMNGSGRSYIKNIKLDAPLKASQFTPVTLIMSPQAGNQPDTLWNRYRDRAPDTKEKRTYHVIDSLGDAIHLDRRLRAFEALTQGELNLGYVNIDLKHLLAFNDYEGFRLGGGLRTSHRVSEYFSLGGYGAYGFKDKAWKYGADALVNIYRLRNIWLKYEYRNDVQELGGNHLLPDATAFLTPHLYPLFVSRMDRREKQEVSFNARVIGNLTITGFANRQFVRAFSDYRFISTPVDDVSLYQSSFQLAETGVKLRFAPGEKLVRTATKEIRLGGRFPVFHAAITRGWKDQTWGDFNYTRIDVRIDKTFSILNVGKLSLIAQGGYCGDDIPLSLLYNAQGTYDRFTLGIPNTFQTMRTNEFMHSRYALLHIRHSFLDLLYQKGNFKPHLVIAHSMLWGDSLYPESHSLSYRNAEKGFMESGIQIDNLYNSGLSGIGIGAYYRYGPYALPVAKENWAFKITSSLSF